jgi:hypothetical protein
MISSLFEKLVDIFPPPMDRLCSSSFQIKSHRLGGSCVLLFVAQALLPVFGFLPLLFGFAFTKG